MLAVSSLGMHDNNETSIDRQKWDCGAEQQIALGETAPESGQ
jgi:hypothetical protein